MTDSEHDIPLGGRLKFFYQFWSKICHDRKVLSDISGASIPFIENITIKQSKLPHTIKMNKEEERFVDQEVERLLESNCIRVTKRPFKNGWISNVFVVPKKDGGYRLILNLKHLNKFIKYQKFKMEHIEDLVNMLKQFDWLASIDIKSAYSHIPMSSSCFPFLQFVWKGKFYFYTCLPFGIANGPILFVRVTKVIMNYLRRNLIEMLFYIDDTFIKHASKDVLVRQVDFVVSTFQKCGFTVNWKKSSLEPKQQMVFLGFLIDSVSFSVSLTMSKRCDLFQLVSKVVDHPHRKISIRLLGKIIGKIVATFPACPLAPLHYRTLKVFKVKQLRRTEFKWNRLIRLSQACIRELDWWKCNIFSGNMIRFLFQEEPSICLITDASNDAWAAIVNSHEAKSRFNEQESQLHINAKELLAIYYGLLSHSKVLKNKCVMIKCDNTTAIATIKKKGSSNTFRNLVTQRVFEHALRNNIRLHISYIPSKENPADWGSRHPRKFNTEWCLSQSDFNYIQTQASFQFDMDLFASHLNNKCPRFCSWDPDPFASHVNCYTLNWSSFNNFAFPPFSQILRLLRKVENDRVRNLGLVCPWWPQSSWFPTLVKHMQAPPLFLPKDSSQRLCIPWNKSLKHPLAGKMKLIFTHLSASCFIKEKSHRELVNTLQNSLGGDLQY